MTKPKDERPQLDRGNISILNAGMLLFCLVGLAMQYQHQTDGQEKNAEGQAKIIALLESHTKDLQTINERHLIIGPTLVHVDETQLTWNTFQKDNPRLNFSGVDIWGTHRQLHPTPPQ